MNAQIMDFYPAKAQFRPEDALVFHLVTSGDNAFKQNVVLSLYHLHDKIASEEVYVTGPGTCEIRLQKRIRDCGGYGARIETVNGEKVATAFDIANHWSEAPRYGFLSDFHPHEEGDFKDIHFLNKHHINVVQFYDWMYRHDQPVHDEQVYTDPLGRTISMAVIEKKIAAAHQKGMACMAYGAIYAALKDFYEQHPDWALYQNDGKPFTLADIFYIMDISNEDWNDHIIHEFKKVIRKGFDGIHLDQYGFPKRALRKHHHSDETVDLSRHFTPFINRTKKELIKVKKDVGLIFNNVSNFPTYATGQADQEAVYIEVWTPVNRFYDLKVLIDQARLHAQEKPIILAAYLSPFFKSQPNFSQKKAENGGVDHHGRDFCQWCLSFVDR